MRDEIRRLPLEWGDALPAAGSFVGHLYYLRVGTPGWHYWDGAMWVGPLGVGGGGGGAPVGAQYLVGAADGTLTSERVVTDTNTVEWDLATAGQAKADVPVFSATKDGSVPTPGTPAGAFLKDDGTWAVPIDTNTGEVNTGISLGVGVFDVFKGKVGVDLEFRSLKEGSLIAMVLSADEIEIKVDIPTRSALVRQVGPPTSVAFPAVSILARKGSGDITSLAFAANTVLGRLGGDLADLTQVDLDALMNVATSKTANAIVRSSGAGLIDGDLLKPNTLAPASLLMAGFGHMLRTQPSGGTATAESFAISLQSVVGRLGSITDVVPIVAAASRVLGRKSTGDLAFLDGDGVMEAMKAGVAGTSFPVSDLWDGRTFTRTDMGNMAFTYDSSISGWLSVELFQYAFGDNVDRAYGGTPIWVRTNTGGHSVGRPFSTTIGYQLPFACKVVGMALNMAASGTCSVQVGNGATGITGAVLTLTAVQSESDFTLLSNTIPANGIMTVAVASGTLQGPANGYFFARRFET